ncbi:MAG: hypothetical protein R3F20_11930 [Planctomycetota bacterium]
MSDRDDKITCRTPTPGKTPVRIPRWKYDALRAAILAATPRRGEGVLFGELSEAVADRLDDDVLSRLGSIPWHVTTVKLDLECRGELHRVAGARPQRLLRGPGPV